MDTDLIKRDLSHVWHPCSQMKDYENFPPIPIARAEGPMLYTEDGVQLIDAISSWWCKSLGHGHPRVKAAVSKQMDRFEHVIAANTCNRQLVELSERLASIATDLNHVFYADNGSTAVEIAIKMCLQYHAQTGHTERTQFLSLENGYHGETVLTLAAGDCELYSKPYAPLMPTINKLGPIPFVSGEDDSNWACMPDDNWAKIESQLTAMEDTLAGVIFEPVVQGAGNMKIYSPDLLRRLRQWADKHGVQLIADEIMTGFGRTGKMLACEHAGIAADYVCLSKGLTGGFSPLSAVLCSQQVYDAFYDDYFSGKAFLHSNTYTGHALGVAAALEVLKVYEDEQTIARVVDRGPELKRLMQEVGQETGALVNIRQLGFIAAAEIINPDTGQPFPKERRTGFKYFQQAVKHGALLRPLGDTIYFFPPLNTPDNILNDMAEIAAKALRGAIA